MNWPENRWQANDIQLQKFIYSFEWVIFHVLFHGQHRTNSTKTNLSSTEKDYEEVGMDSGEGENEGGEEY